MWSQNIHRILYLPSLHPRQYGRLSQGFDAGRPSLSCHQHLRHWWEWSRGVVWIQVHAATRQQRRWSFSQRRCPGWSYRSPSDPRGWGGEGSAFQSFQCQGWLWKVALFFPAQWEWLAPHLSQIWRGEQHPPGIKIVWYYEMLQTSTWKGFSCAGRWGYFTSNWDQKLSADMADALKIGHIDWEANCNWKALIHKSVRLHISWQNLGAEGIADKELLLGCHLLVEEPQLLPVEICPPLVSSSYPPGGVEVEDTLRTI